LAVSDANACGNGKLVFEDKFETLDPAWGFGPPSENASRSNGPKGLVYKYAADHVTGLLNQTSVYNDYEVCAEFTTEGAADASPWVGVLFWGSDTNNVYEASISLKHGTFRVNRYQNGKTLYPVNFTPSDSINQGTTKSVTNEISVTVNGKKATFAVNKAPLGRGEQKRPAVTV
jgi:hypothetical protein